ncbi:MAG: hypothetical protein WHT84_09045 [Breznakiellaceae bacterium]
MIQDEVRLTAELAQLDMTEEELRQALPAIEQMLTFFAAMDTFSLAVPPEASPAREDTSSLFLHAKEALPYAVWKNSYDNQHTQASHIDGDRQESHPVNPTTLVTLAGETRHSFIVVPNVL